MKIPDTWSFDIKEVADNFDDHVKEQLPWYDLVTNAVAHIARHYIHEGGIIYDIGASNGNIGRAIEKTITERNAKLIGIEKSPEMANKYNAEGEICITDALEFDYQKADLIVCFLTIMFIHPKDRKEFIQKLKSSLNIGGALIIVDKCLPISGYPATILSRLALSEKLNAGAEPKAIIDKELSLSGIQVPIDISILPDNAVEFFKFGDFAGWIIEK